MKKILTLSALVLALTAGTPALADGYRDSRHYDRDRHERYYDGHRYSRHSYHPGKHRGWQKHHWKRDHPVHIVRYSRDHHGRYYADRHGHYVVHREHGHDYYKWIGGAILLSEILHHSR